MIDDDDIPFADPAIRTDYEAALGAFILHFNEMDFYVSQIIGWELGDRVEEQVASRLKAGSFATRIDTLDALAERSANDELQKLPFARIRSLNSDRNRLAHGHFDQNPFDGSYRLVLAQKVADYPIKRVKALGRELETITDSLRSVYYWYFFEDLAESSRSPEA